MKSINRSIIYEIRFFLSTPVAVHLCIIHLAIRLIKDSLKESRYFK
jgi:hypothetical protein